MKHCLLWMFVGCACIVASSAQAQTSWNFSNGLGDWVANSALSNVTVKNGIVEMDATQWDPFLLNRNASVKTTPWQYIVIRMKASANGTGELFWSWALTGDNGGLSQGKSLSFQITGDGEWHDIVIVPGWQIEGTIRQIRLDVFEGAHFAIDRIDIHSWGEDPVQTEGSEWRMDQKTLSRIGPDESPLLVAPRLGVSTEQWGWITIKAKSSKSEQLSFFWTCEKSIKTQRKSIMLKPDGKFHVYNIELQGEPEWSDKLVMLGIELPRETSDQFEFESVALSKTPQGPPEIELDYLGFENAPFRAEKVCTVLAKIVNIGTLSGNIKLILKAIDGASIQPMEGEADPEQRILPSMRYGKVEYVRWNVLADQQGSAHLTLAIEASPQTYVPEPINLTLTFDPPLDLPQADYVPEPKPIETAVPICMYYFPGWDAPAKWVPIQRVSPIRKPMLGWYDEANPECVDWQIKWAVENGIGCFLLDWYWIQSRQFLDHWLNAYKQARYRDYLKIAIMWANHNPSGTHSREDWNDVTKWWIDHVFPLPGYFQINGMPAVFIWYPDGARLDMGGTEAFTEAIKDSQELAKKAGYKGIAFVAVNGAETSYLSEQLFKEGFVGSTNYHEFAEAPNLAPSRTQVDYKDLVETSPVAWEKRQQNQNGLEYYPVADSGWDARPWHGDDTMVMSGRTLELWEKLLHELKAFLDIHPKPLIVLGPANEWGEGSYLEPNLEYGFGMYEKVRKVFGKGDPASWPINFAPSDVGLGPYDMQTVEITPHWTFDDDTAQGWVIASQISDLRAEKGMLKMRTIGDDNNIMVNTPGLFADIYGGVEIKMQAIGQFGPLGSMAQLFWSRDGHPLSSAASMSFMLNPDGEMHTYTLDLTQNPQWRSEITSLRFDPTSTSQIDVSIDEIKFIKKENAATGSENFD